MLFHNRVKLPCSCGRVNLACHPRHHALNNRIGHARRFFHFGQRTSMRNESQESSDKAIGNFVRRHIIKQNIRRSCAPNANVRIFYRDGFFFIGHLLTLELRHIRGRIELQEYRANRLKVSVFALLHVGEEVSDFIPDEYACRPILQRRHNRRVARHFFGKHLLRLISDCREYLLNRLLRIILAAR